MNEWKQASFSSASRSNKLVGLLLVNICYSSHCLQEEITRAHTKREKDLFSRRIKADVV